MLAIDCGNTNTRFCLLQGLALQADWRRATDDNRTADEDLVWLTQLMSLSGFAPAQIRNVVIASVRPQSTFGLKRLSQKLTNRDAIVVGEGDVMLPVAERLIRPGQVGADRLVNARALKDTDQVPAIVVDFGTATTFDYVDKHGLRGRCDCPGRPHQHWRALSSGSEIAVDRFGSKAASSGNGYCDAERRVLGLHRSGRRHYLAVKARVVSAR